MATEKPHDPFWWIVPQDEQLRVAMIGCLLGSFLGHTFTALLFHLWKGCVTSTLPVASSNEPEMLPYWFPYIGHAISMYRDSIGLIKQGYKYCGGDRDEPFSIMLLGQKYHVIPSMSLISSVYKNHPILTTHGIIQDVYQQVGVSEEGLKIIYKGSTPEKVLHISLGSLIQQFSPGQLLDDISVKMLGYAEQKLQWAEIPDLGSPQSRSNSAGTSTKTVGLHQWCAHVLAHSSAKALFGNALLEASPAFVNQIYVFDELAWHFILKFPKFFAGKMEAAKASCTQAFVHYLQLPSQERPGMCQWVESIEAKQREAGMTELDIAKSFLVFFWAFVTNTYKTCFWLLIHIIHTPGAVEDIRDEISYCVGSDGEIDSRRITEICPVLMAALNEVLRLTNTDSARKVEQPVVIGTKTIPPGGRLFLPHRQMHRDEAVVGKDPESFKLRRFYDNDLDRHPSFKPFGGGASLCPGRHIAKLEILSFVAFVLHHYDVEPHSSYPGLPRRNERIPTMGVPNPVDIDTILVNVSKRE